MTQIMKNLYLYKTLLDFYEQSDKRMQRNKGEYQQIYQ